MRVLSFHLVLQDSSNLIRISRYLPALCAKRARLGSMSCAVSGLNLYALRQKEPQSDETIQTRTHSTRRPPTPQANIRKYWYMKGRTFCLCHLNPNEHKDTNVRKTQHSTLTSQTPGRVKHTKCATSAQRLCFSCEILRVVFVPTKEINLNFSKKKKKEIRDICRQMTFFTRTLKIYC